MNRLEKVAVILSVLLLSACATNQPITLAREKNYSANDIIYVPSSDDLVQQLTIVKRSDTTKVVALKAMQLILGGSTTGFDKEHIKGNPPTDLINKERVSNPTPIVFEEIKKELSAFVQKNPILVDKKFEGKIVVKSAVPMWKLTYDKLASSEENKYHLGFAVTMARGGHVSKCTYQSESFLLENWVLNDYQKVADLRSVAVQECVKQLKSQFPILMRDSFVSTQ